MDPVNLAYPEVSCPGCGVAIHWIARMLVKDPVVGIPIGILVIGILIVVLVRFIRRRRGAKRLAGTAQVLAVETITTTVDGVKSNGCRIALRVRIPGRPEYNATSSNGDFMTSVEIAAVQPGKIVPVEIASTNPQDVWIDFSSIT